ncbi:MAG TPA: SUF system NifU family Fe-S cluster assembly protein [Longimicrobiales bacterium]|nr:SUF system NifU family Fe-S cluster assembly protein [Longimicrobiales bacterium]
MAVDRSTPNLGSLYQELILDHFRRPRNRGVLPGANTVVHMHNPVCGDEVKLYLHLEGDQVTGASFEGQGCSISQASVSMMTQLVQGHSVDEARRLAARFTAMLHGDADAAADRALGDLRALAGVHQFPVRVKCALLGWNALEKALESSADIGG